MLMQFYGAGLEQLVATPAQRAGDTCVHRVAADPLVGALLALHDLHPVELADAAAARGRHGASAAGCARLGHRADRGRRRRHGPRPRPGRRLRGRTRCATWSRPRWPSWPRTPQGWCSTGRPRGRRCCRSGSAGRDGGVAAPLPARSPTPRRRPAPERCELCATPVPAEHPHLVELASGGCCARARPCGLLFSEPGAGRRYRRVPDRYLYDPGFVLSDAQWDELQIPVGMAFFLLNSIRRAVVACYPSPAGATESELSLAAWADGVGGGRARRRAGAGRRGAAGAPR